MHPPPPPPPPYIITIGLGLRNSLGMVCFSQSDVLNDDHENERKDCGHTVSSVVVTDDHTLYEPMLLLSHYENYQEAITVVICVHHVSVCYFLIKFESCCNVHLFALIVCILIPICQNTFCYPCSSSNEISLCLHLLLCRTLFLQHLLKF